jgi:hypothetical protein
MAERLSRALASIREESMSEQGGPRGGNHQRPPPCEVCGNPMNVVVSIPRVSEPRSVRLFECSTCGKLEFIPET